MKLRIGNTINFKLRISRANEPYDLRDKNLLLVVTHERKQEAITLSPSDFSIMGVNNNVIFWTFEGKDQKHTGKYIVTLYENRGLPNQAVVDFCDALTLVGCSCETDNERCCGNAEIETVELCGNFLVGGAAQFDWKETDPNSPSYGHNLPTKLSDFENDEEFVSVPDLENKLEEYVTGESLDTTLDDYVQKEEGKGLSSNDFTNDFKSKLVGIEAGAQKNVQSDYNVDDPDDDRYIKNKVTKVSQLDNDQQFVKQSDLNTELSTKADLADGKVPASQLPSFVDDVLEFATLSAFPATGEAGKIYVTLDTNLTYRWSGSGYVEISPSLALGATPSTAYRGDRGEIAYIHSQSAHAPSDAQKNSDITKAEIESKLTGTISTHSHTVTKSDVGLGNVNNTSDANKPISTAQQAALDDKEDITNKVQSLSTSSTHDQYPTAKCMYDMIGNLETLLAAI